MFLRCAGRVALTLLCGLSIAISGFAQSERGTITGSVHDASGAVVPGAKVTITQIETNVATNLATNEAGEYTAPSLPAGTYNIRVEKQGFRPSQVTGLKLDAASTARADATLEVGAATQAIEVQATAVQLHTEDAKTSITVENQLINDLPLVVGGTVRTPFDLAALTPESKNLGGDNGFMLGGGQASSYGTTLDGVSANTTRALQKSWVASNSPSVEALSEFTVDTNGFKAEYGHSGGGVMTFTTKSGTNGFHGVAYEFLRNNDFDANNFFNDALKQPIKIYKQNDFGVTLGGPVWIPKVYNGKEKTFFFFSYEGFRNRNGASSNATTVPTSEMYNGDFSNWVDSTGKQIPIYNPLDPNRAPFTGNKIPQSMFSPTFQQALKVFQTSGVLTPNNGAPPGTLAYVQNNYLINRGTDVNPVNKWSIKGDHIFNERHRISGYYGNDRESITPGAEGPATLPGLYTNYNDLRQYSDVVRFSWDWTFGANKFNHFYAGGNNWRQNHNPPQEYIGDWKSKFCLANVPDCNDNLVNFTWSGYGGWGGQANNGSENTIIAYNDDFTWIHGKHAFKFGGMLQISHYNGFGRQCISGCVGFDYTETAPLNSTNPTQGGNSFASALLGLAHSGQIDTIRFIGQQWPYYAGYFQDDWRVSPKLVLNLGIRWETQLPATGLDDRWSDFSPTTPNPKADGRLGALIYAGSGAGRVGSRTLGDSYFKDFGPHVGFAYNWSDKLVIRGSYALSYGAITTVSGSTHQRGFTLTYSPPSGSGGNPSFLIDNGFPAWTAPPFIDPSFSNGDSMPWFQGNEASKAPQFNNFNLSIQRQLTNSMVLEAAYNGVMGSHLQSQLLLYNQVPTSYLTAFGGIDNSIAVLNSRVGSALANQYGITAPFSAFDSLWKNNNTVRQALRPYPQYQTIDTYSGGGDHSGHSTYHSGMIRLEKRYAAGLTFQTSYVFSKILTDSDSYWGGGIGSGISFSGAMDQYNRGLEKSIGLFDVTHNFKFAGSYDLPFGKGRKYLTHGPAAWIIGNWRIASVNVYTSGTPIGLRTSYSVPLFNGRMAPYATSYDGWQPSNWGSGGFDPNPAGYAASGLAGVGDRFFVPYGSGPFPLQGTNTALNSFGNMTRYNPRLRTFPDLNENISITRSFPIHESIRLEFRAEAFNVFNRVRFGTGSTQLQSTTFGVLTSSSDLLNSPRQLQLALKLYY